MAYVIMWAATAIFRQPGTNQQVDGDYRAAFGQIKLRAHETDALRQPQERGNFLRTNSKPLAALAA